MSRNLDLRTSILQLSYLLLEPSMLSLISLLEQILA